MSKEPADTNFVVDGWNNSDYVASPEKREITINDT
jgi:hypothetical protein